MKTLLLVFGLFGGLFGNAVEEDRTLQQEDCDVVLTEAQEELKAYAEGLIVELDLENLERTELAAVRAEINELIAAKAAELGVELPINPDHEMNENMGGANAQAASQGAKGSQAPAERGTGDGACDYETEETVVSA